MREYAFLTWGNPTGNERFLNSETTYTTVNFDKIPDASGNYAANDKPIISWRGEEGLYYADITGISVGFDAVSRNYATSVTITMQTNDGTETHYHEYNYVNDKVFAFFPINEIFAEEETITSLYVIVNSAKRGGAKLKFDFMLFGHSYKIPHTLITRLSTSASADFSGCSAPFGTMSATINAAGLEEILGHRQLITLSTNRRYIGEYYVDSITRKGRKAYEVKAVDALGCLATEKYEGGVFTGSVGLYSAIVSALGNDYFIGSDATYNPNGIIQEGDKRAALLQFATAGGCWLDGNYDNFGTHEIALRPVDYTSEAVLIDGLNTYQNPAVIHEDITTNYSITSHSFSADANGNIVVGNAHYKDTRTENNYVLGTSTGKPSKKTLSGATLVTNAAALTNARRLMRERYSRRKIWRGSYLWQDGDEGRVGAVVQVRTADGAIIYGNVIKADLSFSAASIRVDADVLSFETLPAMEIWLGEEADVLTWSSDVPDASRFEIYRDGVLIGETDGNEWPAEAPGDYIVIARGDRGAYSEASNVVHIAAYREELAPSPAYSVAVPLAALARATLYKVGGKSVKWNQLVDTTAFPSRTINGVTSVNNGNGTITYTGTATANFETKTANVNVINTHKYFVFGCPQGGGSTKYYVAFSGIGASADFGSGSLYTATADRQTGASIYIRNGAVFNDAIFSPRIIDLTAIYGAGNEPTSTTDARIAELKAIAAALPQYDAGSIKHAAVDIVRGDAPVIIPQAVRDLPDYGAGVGDVYNEIDMEPVVYHNMKAVDLGTLTWTTASGLWYAPIADKINDRDNIVLSKYGYAGSGNFAKAQTIPDTCAFASNGTSQPYVYIKDSALVGLSPAQVKTALSGVILRYEVTSGGTDYAARLYHRRIAHRTIDGTQTLSVWKTYGVSTPFDDMKKFVANNPTVGLCDRLENVVDANIVNGRPRSV